MALHPSRIAGLTSLIEEVCADSITAPFPAVSRPWEHVLPRFVDAAGEGATRRLLERVKGIGQRYDMPVYITPVLYTLLKSGTTSANADTVDEGSLTLLCLCAPPNHIRSGPYLYGALSESIRSPACAENAYGAVRIADALIAVEDLRPGQAPWMRWSNRVSGTYTSGDVLLAAGVHPMLALSAQLGPRAEDWPIEWLEPLVIGLVSDTEADSKTPPDVRDCARVVRSVLERRY
jgi:hypothetical protein